MMILNVLTFTVRIAQFLPDTNPYIFFICHLHISHNTLCIPISPPPPPPTPKVLHMSPGMAEISRGNLKKRLCKILRDVQNGESRKTITTLSLRYKGNRLTELGLHVVKHSVIDLMKKHSWPTLIINRVSLTRTDAELENIIVTFVFPLSDK